VGEPRQRRDFDGGNAGTNTAAYSGLSQPELPELPQYNGEIAVLTSGSDGHDRLVHRGCEFADQTISAQQAVPFGGSNFVASHPDHRGAGDSRRGRRAGITTSTTATRKAGRKRRSTA
jgi:hypothetical protein